MQEVIYEDLPNTCFTCKKQGHWVKNCLNKGKNISKNEKEDKKKEVKVQKKVWKPKVIHAKDVKDNLNSDFQKFGKMPNSTLKENLSSENQEIEGMLDSASLEQNIENMMDKD